MKSQSQHLVNDKAFQDCMGFFSYMWVGGVIKKLLSLKYRSILFQEFYLIHDLAFTHLTSHIFQLSFQFATCQSEFIFDNIARNFFEIVITKSMSFCSMCVSEHIHIYMIKNVIQKCSTQHFLSNPISLSSNLYSYHFTACVLSLSKSIFK